MPGPDPTEPRPVAGPVVVAGGHLVDGPGRAEPRFPPSAEPSVADAVGGLLAGWRLGPGGLLITGGARGADVIAAEAALDRGADVWLLLALPDEEFVAASVELPGTAWADRHRRLRRRCPTWFLPADPGGSGGTGPGPGDAFERANEWMLRAGLAQAPGGRLRVLAVWDGRPGDGPGGTADLVERARRAGVEVAVVPPRPAPG